MKYEYGSLQWKSSASRRWMWNQEIWEAADIKRDYEVLGMLGEQGWDLVSVVTAPTVADDPDPGTFFIYYFKRPLP